MDLVNFFTSQRKIIFAFGIALIALSFILVLEKTKKTPEELSIWHDDQKVLILEVVNTPEKRHLGLSGRESLATDRALLFIFDKPDKYGIWMKDMNFPIDIIWLDQNFEVVNFKKSVAPATYPTVFKPATPALYVLETNSGFIDEVDLKIGQTLDLHKGILKN